MEERSSRGTSPIERAKYLLPFFPFSFRPKPSPGIFFLFRSRPEFNFRSSLFDEDRHRESKIPVDDHFAVLQRRLIVLRCRASTRGRPVQEDPILKRFSKKQLKGAARKKINQVFIQSGLGHRQDSTLKVSYRFLSFFLKNKFQNIESQH